MPDGSGRFDVRRLAISDRLSWGKIEVLSDSKTRKLWRVPVFVAPRHQFGSPEVQRAAREIVGPEPTEAQGGRYSQQPQ
eukprot:2252391-Alexandrium_andersonii.AAC.1